MLRRFAHIGNRVFRKSYKKNAYVFIATANQTKLKKKTSAKSIHNCAKSIYDCAKNIHNCAENIHDCEKKF